MCSNTWNNFAVTMKPMLAEDWYAVFVSYGIGDIDNEDFWPNMSLFEWEMNTLTDEINYTQMREGLQTQYQLEIPPITWDAMFRDSDKTTLADLCYFLESLDGCKPLIVPMQIGGRLCRPAAVFLTLRAVMSSDGCSTSELTPSTPLSQLSTDQQTSLFNAICRINPRLAHRIHMPRETVIGNIAKKLALIGAGTVFAFVGWIIAALEGLILIFRWTLPPDEDAHLKDRHVSMRDVCYML